MLARTIASVARRPASIGSALTVKCSAAPLFSLSAVRLNMASKQTAAPAVNKEFKRWATNASNPQPNSFVTKPLEGPISPHFLIYRFPLPGLTSGAHRATGFALSLVFATMGILSLFSPDAFPVFIDMIKNFVPVLLPFLKGLLAFPIAYHFWAGCRHLYWDSTGNGLEDAETLDKSCYIVIGLSVATTLALALV